MRNFGNGRGFALDVRAVELMAGGMEREAAYVRAMDEMADAVTDKVMIRLGHDVRDSRETGTAGEPLVFGMRGKAR